MIIDKDGVTQWEIGDLVMLDSTKISYSANKYLGQVGRVIADALKVHNLTQERYDSLEKSTRHSTACVRVEWDDGNRNQYSQFRLVPASADGMFEIKFKKGVLTTKRIVKADNEDHAYSQAEYMILSGNVEADSFSIKPYEISASQ